MNIVAEALEELSRAVATYARAVVAMVEPSTVLLGTAAAREMAEEHRLRCGGYTIPSELHSLNSAWALLRRRPTLSLGRLVTMDPPAIYAPFVVTRSLLDAAGWIHWLAEFDIGPEGRVKRRLLLDVLEAAEQRPPDRPAFREKRAQLRRVPQDVKAFCDQHGWSADVGKKPDNGGERRPRQTMSAPLTATGLGSTASSLCYRGLAHTRHQSGPANTVPRRCIDGVMKSFIRQKH